MNTRYNAKLTMIVIINIACLLLSISFENTIVLLLSGINIVIGVWGKDKEKIARDNNVFMIMSVLNFLCFKWVSFAFYVAMHVKANQKSKLIKALTKDAKVVEKEKIDPQIRKIDILLKLGVAMVFIAGFVFATTGWYSLSSILKIFIFLIVAALFIWLSKFCEAKIKIKSTIYLYWILGMSFIFLIFLTIGYSEMFGRFFSLVGSGRLLFMGFCSLVLSSLGLATYFNFKDKFFLQIVYSGLLVATVFVSEYLGLVVEEILVLLLPIFTVIKLIKMDKEKDSYTLSIFSDIMILILGILYLCFLGTYTNVFAVVVLTSLFIFNIYSYVRVDTESDLSVFASALSYAFLIPSLILLVGNSTTGWVLITTIFVTLLYFVSLLFNSKKLKNASLMTADIITILVFVISTSGPVWVPLAVALLSLLICIVCTFIDVLDDYDFEVFVHPIKLSMVIFGGIFLLNSYFGFDNVMGYWLSSTLLTYILIYSLSRKKILVDIYEKFSIGAIIIALLFTTAIPNLLISIIIFLSVILFYADVNWAKNCTNKFKNVVYILLMINIFISSHAIENSLVSLAALEDSNYFFANIVSVVLFILVGLFHREDDFKLDASLIAVLVPIYTLIETYTTYDWVSIVLPAIFVYYLTFVLTTRIIKKEDQAKKVVGYFGYSYAFILILFTSDYYVLAFTFILLIISLLLGYFDKEFDALFKVSVVALIVEILYQLKEFWNLIPAWLYLLFVGIALIVFATYKQLKIVEKNKDNKK